MKQLRIMAVAAGLAFISSAASGIPTPIANPEIYGEWQLEMTLDTIPTQSKGNGCVFSGPMELTMGSFVKEAEDKISDPVNGEASMQVISGPCEDFFGEISGNAFANNIFFVMQVFPGGPMKGGEKGPGFSLNFEGDLIDSSLMEGIITEGLGKDKGVIGTWRATRGRGVPSITPVGMLLLLAGLGLVGGIALYRRR